MAIFNRKKNKNKHDKKLHKALLKEQKTHSRAEPHLGKELFSWVSPKYIKHEKGAKWYLAAGIMALLMVIYGLLNDAWTFSLLIIVFAAVYYVQQFEEPKNIKVTIAQLGLKIGGKSYQYRNIKAFWIYYAPGEVETLNLLTTDKIMPEISIQLNGQDPALIRDFLLNQVPEWEGRQETFTEALIRILKI